MKTKIVIPNVYLSENEFKDATVSLRMMHSKGYIRKPTLIGECCVDLSAVHARITHEVRGRYKFKQLLLTLIRINYYLFRFFPLQRKESP